MVVVSRLASLRQLHNDVHAPVQRYHPVRAGPRSMRKRGSKEACGTRCYLSWRDQQRDRSLSRNQRMETKRSVLIPASSHFLQAKSIVSGKALL